MFAARGAGGEQAPEEEKMGEPKKSLAPYIKAFKMGTQFKTTCHPDVVEGALVATLKE